MKEKKHKKLLNTLKKRNKLRLNIQRKNCSIKKQKIKKNKFLKNKKKILRLTKKLCAAKKNVKKLMNKLGILKVKNNNSLI
jgi:exonuclease I